MQVYILQALDSYDSYRCYLKDSFQIAQKSIIKTYRYHNIIYTDYTEFKTYLS